MAKPQAVRLQPTTSLADVNWRPVRKVFQYVGLALCAVALGYGGRQLIALELFPLHVVHVEGTSQIQKQHALEQQLMAVIEGGVLTVNLNELKESAEALPWVQSADVERVWPDAVRIRVTEQQVVARWGAHKFVNSVGDVLRNTDGAASPKLPILNGPDGTGPLVLEKFRSLQHTANSFGHDIVRVDRSLNNLLTVYVDAGFALRLGHQHPEQRLEQFFEAYAAGAIEHKNEIEYADLRYSDGFSVMRKQ